MLNVVTRDLASEPSLAGFHSARAVLYLASARLLSSSPPRQQQALREMGAQIRDAAGVLGDARPWMVLAGRLLVTSPETLASARARLREVPALCCTQPRSRQQHEAFTIAGVEASDSRSEEAEVLAALGVQASTALSRGNFPQAAERSALQREFFVQHARLCLSQLAATLLRLDDRVFTQLGRAIGWLVEHDSRLLSDSEPDETPTEASKQREPT